MKTTCTLKLDPGPRVPDLINGRTLYTKREALCLNHGGLLFLTGGSKSGKSRWAERWAMQMALQSAAPLIYIATLRAGKDPENLRRIALHRAQREGKGFQSLECPGRLEDLNLRREGKEVYLLECLGNLIANAITDAGLWQGKAEDRQAMERLTDEISQSILRLAADSGQLLLVSNDIFSDVIRYDDGSLLWRDAMARCQEILLSQEMTCAVEVSAGIPLLWKRAENKGGIPHGSSQDFT